MSQHSKDASKSEQVPPQHSGKLPRKPSRISQEDKPN